MIDGKTIDQVIAKLNTPVAHNHFFMKIKDPRWLTPLVENGYFKHPTPALREDGYVSFPLWTEGEYLVRVADKAQDQVLEIIRQLPDTDNERVMTNVVDALLKIETSKAVEMTGKVKAYIQKPQYLLLDKSIANLISKFATDGAIKEAIELTRLALEVLPDPATDTESDDEFSWQHPKTKFSDHDYHEMVKKITPVLVDKAPDKAADIYADLAKNVVRYEHRGIKESKDKKTLEDMSLIWRPVIEYAGEYPNHPRDTLIDALNESLVALVKTDKITSEAKVRQLNGLLGIKLSVIKRSVEYALRDNHQEKGLTDIHKPLAKEFARIIKRPAVQFSSEFEPVGNSGIEQEDFDKLDNNALIEKLNTYEPSSSLYSDREALGNNVEAAAKNNPNRFIALLPKIAKTKYLYLYSVVNAFYQNIDSLSPEQIGSASKAFVKIFGAKTEESEESRDYYKWAKASAARFAEKAFDKSDDKKRERISTKQADDVLNLILLMCRDDDLTAEYEISEEGNLDAASLSLNTIRGEAMHAIIHAMVWANRNKSGSDLLDKVFGELTRGLDDPTQTIRSVYGMHYSNIWGTRKAWAEDNKDRIFSDNELGRVAVDTYTSFSGVHPDAITILGDVYKRQLTRLRIEPPDEKKRTIAREGLKHLVQHLSLHYWYGAIDLANGSMMKELIDTSHSKYLAEAINFIGFRLYKSEERSLDITDEALTRLKDLWEYLIATVKEDNSKKEALEDFGTWFASGQFDDNWSLDQLLAALKIAGSVDLDFAVLERLEKLVSNHPVKAIGIVDAMVDGATRDRWAIGSWRDNAVSILKTAYQSDDDTVKQMVRELANKLVKKGYEEYRDVLK
ncbi:MAG: hypothetical protein PWQ10_609 [Patescibacteria group bacterium]|nr:hypothetical protein [Patescibacteria group bacterium]